MTELTELTELKDSVILKFSINLFLTYIQMNSSHLGEQVYGFFFLLQLHNLWDLNLETRD